MPVPVSRNQARLVAKVCRARVREINAQLECCQGNGSRTLRTALLAERSKLLELTRLFEAHGDLPASKEPFGELGTIELNLIARACRSMVPLEAEEARRIRERMPGREWQGSAPDYERLAAYFQKKADDA